jgi:hypothetical protein
LDELHVLHCESSTGHWSIESVIIRSFDARNNGLTGISIKSSKTHKNKTRNKKSITTACTHHYSSLHFLQQTAPNHITFYITIKSISQLTSQSSQSESSSKKCLAAAAADLEILLVAEQDFQINNNTNTNNTNNRLNRFRMLHHLGHRHLP